MSELYEQIFDLVRMIPAGRVSSYGAIARALGSSSGARVVGYAMASSHGVLPAVPAHRVLNRNGVLTGKHHFGAGTEMQQLLEAEGLRVVDDKVQDFDKVYWDPTSLTI